MAIEDSIVLITSPDPENRNFGTGFVIHSDADADYVVTCRHVVVEAAAKATVCINYHPYPLLDIFMNKSSDPDDLAVLKISGPLGMPPLPLGSGESPGAPIRIYGYYLYSKNPDTHRK